MKVIIASNEKRIKWILFADKDLTLCDELTNDALRNGFNIEQSELAHVQSIMEKSAYGQQ